MPHYSNMGSVEYICWCITIAGVGWLFTIYPYTFPPAKHEIAPANHIVDVQEYRHNGISLADKVKHCKQNKECTLLAQAGYYEARGESLLGVWSVMHVVLNRVRDDRWPNSVEGVLSYRCQFSYKCDGSMKQGYNDKKSLDKMMIAAYDVLHGNVESPVGEANHYYAQKKVNPYWAKHYKYVATVDDHTFYEWR